MVLVDVVFLLLNFPLMANNTAKTSVYDTHQEGKSGDDEKCKVQQWYVYQYKQYKIQKYSSTVRD